MQDRFQKLMLVLIAALLVANLMKSRDYSAPLELPSVLNSAQAQSSSSSSRNRNAEEKPVTYRLKALEGQNVEDIQSVAAVGDGKSFVVSNTKGFMVYQVVPSR